MTEGREWGRANSENSKYMHTHIVDGKKIRDKLQEELKAEILTRSILPTLVLFYVGTNPVIDTFVRLKKKFGGEIGIPVDIKTFPDTISEDELIIEIKRACTPLTGIVVQLPLPKHINQENVTNSVPVEYDVDVLSSYSFSKLEKGTSKVLPPVIGAIREIVKYHDIDFKDKHVVIIGKGKLVGEPAMLWLRSLGIVPTVLTRSSTDFFEQVKKADVLITGAGTPRLISKDMVKAGAVLIDAGTSESEARIVGDIDPEASLVASIFTPVPGGIGPITIAVLFKNLFILTEDI